MRLLLVGQYQVPLVLEYWHTCTAGSSSISRARYPLSPDGRGGRLSETFKCLSLLSAEPRLAKPQLGVLLATLLLVHARVSAA